MKVLLILAIHITLAYGALPSDIDINKCPRHDHSTSKCVANILNTLRPYLKKGIPEVNVPRLEPFKMKHLELEGEIPGLVLKGEASNIVARGGGDFEIKDMKVDMNNYVIEMHVFIKQLTVTADYMTHGSKIFLMSINGSGQFKGTFNDLHVVVRTYAHPQNRDGLEYAVLDDVSVDVKFGESVLDCSPDYPNLKAKKAAAFIKKHSSKILLMMKDIINKAAAPIVFKYIYKIYNSLPLSDLFES